MKRTSKRVIAFFLILVLVLSLCACAQKQQAGTDEPNRSADGETLSGMPDQKLPEKLRPGAGGSDMQPTPTGFSAEAEQSLVWLRERMAFPQTMFGVALLGYTGETSDGDWLSEVDQAMLQKYPFISEIDTGHTIGDDDYLYCLVPLDENATVSVNLMRWDSKSDTEEVIEVLYRSEVGDPLLIFAAGGDDAYAYLSYIQVQIVDNAGNSCVWEPQLYTSTGHIVPCFSENGDYLSFDFTEYGWQGVPSELAPWLADGWSGVYASGLGGSWTTQAAAWDTDRIANYYLWFFPEDEMGGTVELYWEYEGADPSKTTWEEVWSGFWTTTSVMDGPSYVTVSLSLVGGDNYGVTDGPYYISETYPILMSPSGEEMVIGAGENEVSLPFMPKYDAQLCVLTLNSLLTDPLG